MCGRTRLSVPPGDLADVFGAPLAPSVPNADDAVNLNCAPTDPILVVRRARDSASAPAHGADGLRELVLMRWGLVPFYVHDFRDAKPLINARVETVATSRAFRDSFKKRRCLVLADGFYEWRHEGKRRLPHLVQRSDKRAFGMAGVWDRWKGERHGKIERIETCAVITREPSAAVAAVHDRMPVALEEKDHAAWLEPSTELPELQAILARSISDWVVTPIDRMPDPVGKKQMRLFA
jgi:putative SOS response-associated peptidase YedK